MILISGDSWGVGEWGMTVDKKYSVLHGGLGFYLDKLGYDIKIVAKGGCSNQTAINNIRNNLSDKVKKIIWFQTDPIRDLHPYKTVHFKKIIQNYDSAMAEQKNLLNTTYKQLNDLNIKICCLGGCSKLDIDLIKQYENLIPLIPCITEFFYPDYVHPDIWMSGWHFNITTNETLDFIEPEKKKQDNLSNKEYSDLFFPDGLHPNRKAHKILSEYIISNFLNVY